QHDLRILAAELQRRRDDTIRHDAEELLAGVRRTGEGDGVDVAVVREGLADGAARSRDDVHHAGGKSGGGRERTKLERGERGEGRGLQDDGVPRGKGRRDPAASEEERIVPG